jgi:hypothetical protein
MRLAANRTTHLALIAIITLTSLLASYGPIFVRVARAQDSVLLDDRFVDNANGWELATTNAKMFVGGNTLQLNIKKENAAAWVTPNLSFPNDVEMSVDVTVPDAKPGMAWNAAILLRADLRNTDTAFYQFEIAGNGEWAFVTRTAKAAEYKVQKSGKLKNFIPSAKHHLVVSARGTTFTFVVDKIKLGEFTDKSINNDDEPKYLGLLAGTFKGQPSIIVNFTNLLVTTAGALPPTAEVPENVLLKDSFANNTNGWPVKRDTSGSVAIRNNELMVKVNPGQTNGKARFASPTFDFPEDVDVTVTAQVNDTEVQGSWYYGIGLRTYLVDQSTNVYMFLVFNSGEWGFLLLQNNSLKYIVNPTKIDGFDFTVPNKFHVIAKGNTFQFFLNNKKLGEAKDSAIKGQPAYSTALISGAMDEKSQVTARFTDLLILKPE